MKKNFLIVLLLMSALTYSFVYIAGAQDRDKCPSVVNSNRNTIYNTNGQFSKVTTYDANGNVKNITELIADETTISYTKTEAIIHCSNETIFKKIHETHSQLFKRFTCTWKHEKKIAYKHYVIYIDRGDSQILITWAKKNL